MLSLWCLSALLLFKPFVGQRKHGLHAGACYCSNRYVRRSRSILFNWTGKNDHGLNIVELVFMFFNTPENGLGEELTETDHHALSKPYRGCFVLVAGVVIARTCIFSMRQ